MTANRTLCTLLLAATATLVSSESAASETGGAGARDPQPGRPESGSPASDYEAIRLVMPRGDEARGRTAFSDLYCTACHDVAGDEELPGPVAAEPGPVVGGIPEHRNASAVASAIVAPSHTMNEETRARIEGEFSPMGDFSEAMTVRQLIDVVAYIRSVAEGD